MLLRRLKVAWNIWSELVSDLIRMILGTVISGAKRSIEAFDMRRSKWFCRRDHRSMHE